MRIVQLLLACFALLFAGFCGFGFLASFESVPHALAWKVGYAALGVASLAATGALSLGALRGTRATRSVEPFGPAAH
jgi:hypothetical protein